MSYILLRHRLSTCSIHVDEAAVRDAVLGITGFLGVRVLAAGLNTRICRGMYISARNTDHELVKRYGGHVIVVARDLNRCWQRFVIVKELMHMMDGADMTTDTGEEFETLLGEIEAPPAGPRSLQTESEIQAFWMALGVLCPEPVRQGYLRRREGDGISDLQIANELLIPELYVPRLMSTAFEHIVAAIV